MHAMIPSVIAVAILLIYPLAILLVYLRKPSADLKAARRDAEIWRRRVGDAATVRQDLESRLDLVARELALKDDDLLQAREHDEKLRAELAEERQLNASYKDCVGALKLKLATIRKEVTMLIDC